MNRLNRSIAVFIILAALTLTAVLPAFASVKGRQNTAIALTAATAYAAFQKNKTPAVLLALGTAAAWKNYEDARKHESKLRSARVAAYRQQYYGGSSYYRPYRSYRRSYSHPYTSYRRTYYVPRRTVHYVRPSYVTYPSRGYVSNAAYTQPVSQSSTQVAQLQTQVAALKHQMEIDKVAAENAALKAKVADMQSNAASKRVLIGILAVVGLIGIGAAVLGRVPFQIVRKTQ